MVVAEELRALRFVTNEDDAARAMRSLAQ